MSLPRSEDIWNLQHHQHHFRNDAERTNCRFMVGWICWWWIRLLNDCVNMAPKDTLKREGSKRQSVWLFVWFDLKKWSHVFRFQQKVMVMSDSSDFIFILTEWIIGMISIFKLLENLPYNDLKSRIGILKTILNPLLHLHALTREITPKTPHKFRPRACPTLRAKSMLIQTSRSQLTGGAHHPGWPIFFGLFSIHKFKPRLHHPNSFPNKSEIEAKLIWCSAMRHAKFWAFFLLGDLG